MAPISDVRAWTVVGTLAKATSLVGLRRRWVEPGAVAHAARRASDDQRPENMYARRFAAHLAQCSTGDRKALEAARSQMGDDAGVVERAVASGAPVPAVAALAAAWDGLPAIAKEVIRDPAGGSTPGPVMWGKVRAAQMDRKTCGAAVLAMVVLISDPLVTLWLMTGRTLAEHVPPELARLGRDASRARTVEARWHALQRALHREVTKQAYFVAPWPRALGTPPWRIGAVARCADVRWRGTVVDDTDPGEMRAMAAHASAALADGIPVTMITGGDLSRGPRQAFPRHVVLMTSHTRDGFVVYEPSSGARHLLREKDLVRNSTPHPALGRWSRINGFVLPRPRRRR
ncbi:MAG: hypothetical protein WDZ57_00450 [Demequina sp.]